jgi:hypothetical protein
MDKKDSRSFAERFAKKSGNTVAQLAKSQGNQATNDSEITKKVKADPIKKAQADLVYLVTGTDREKSAWYYVLVDRLKVRMFLQAMKSSSINLDDFGKVIYSAYGEKPPEEITNKVKEEYGIED